MVPRLNGRGRISPQVSSFQNTDSSNTGTSFKVILSNLLPPLSMRLGEDIVQIEAHTHTHNEKMTWLLVCASVDLGEDLSCSDIGTSLREILMI